MTRNGREQGGALTTGALLFASGFAGLVYQVLWMRELGALFGSDTYAAATTLAAFFLGIAAGGAAFGRIARRLERPLLGYAALEAAVAVSALLYFGLLDVFYAVYAPLFDTLGASRVAFVAAKFALALGVLFPPAFFMGGTLPLMSEHLVRRPGALGPTVAGLYAVNTLGAALGAAATAFVLVPALGVPGSYTLALAATGGIAACAALLGRTARREIRGASEPPTAARRARRGRTLGALALLSGFATLALEVIWTRMFAQVLHNSVYTFAVILVTFLLALAGGAVLARYLARRSLESGGVLTMLFAGGGVLIAATPLVFDAWTNIEGLALTSGFSAYVARAFGAAALVLGPATLWLGIVFPYLIKAAERTEASPGRTVGDLAALNTLGGVAGSLAAGFFLLEWLGLWGSIGAIAGLYVVAVAPLALARSDAGLRRRGALGAWVVGALAVAGATAASLDLPRVHIRADRERVIDIVEGSASTVAVIRHGSVLLMKHNNHYGLGGTDDFNQEVRQAHVPLALHPAPKRAFFLGLGTGITAGAALQHPLDRLLVAELSPQVVEASRRHFTPWLRGLFDDPRAEVRVEDGRNVLLGSREQFDVIVADLFLPWKAGVGSLYSREHYAAARNRLAPGGIYAQWLLLIQFSREEFGAVARTLTEVFPRVTLWRANSRVSHPLVLLVGERDPVPIDPRSLDRRLEAVQRTSHDQKNWRPELRPVPEDSAQILSYYSGNLTQARALLDGFPIETDARPFVEYSAPVTHRRKRTGDARAFLGNELLDFYDAVFAAAPPETDPVLADVAPPWRHLPLAGLEGYRARVLRGTGDTAGAAEARARRERELSIAFPQAATEQPTPH